MTGDRLLGRDDSGTTRSSSIQASKTQSWSPDSTDHASRTGVTDHRGHPLRFMVVPKRQGMVTCELSPHLGSLACIIGV